MSNGNFEDVEDRDGECLLRFMEATAFGVYLLSYVMGAGRVK